MHKNYIKLKNVGLNHGVEGFVRVLFDLGFCLFARIGFRVWRGSSGSAAAVRTGTVARGANRRSCRVSTGGVDVGAKLRLARRPNFKFWCIAILLANYFSDCFQQGARHPHEHQHVIFV